MSLAVVTVHYADPLLTNRLLNAIKDCAVVERIIVVSHDSFSMRPEGKIEFLQQANRGYAAGLNRGVDAAISSGVKTILAMNPDVTIDCEAVQELLTQHQNATADCTFPMLIEHGHSITGYRFSRFGSLQITDQPEWYSGACFLFEADAWVKVGGFNENYFHYFEDRDFCMRVAQLGGKLYQAKSVIVVHQSKSGKNYVEGDLPRLAVRNHLRSLANSGLLNPFSFVNVVLRHFFYLFRWKGGWRGIPRWIQGVQEFLTSKRR